MIIIDIHSVIKNLGIEDTIKIAKEQGVLIWDSKPGFPTQVHQPVVIKSEYGQFDNIEIVDINLMSQEDKDKYLK